MNIEEATTLLQRVVKVYADYPQFRYGQIIMDMLPIELYNKMTGTEFDLYYLEDNAKVLEIFLEHYVEKDDD